MRKKLDELQKQHSEVQIDDEEQIKEISQIESSLSLLKAKMRLIINQPQVALPFLAIGRLVYIKNAEVDWGWGVYLNFMQKKAGVKKQ